MSTSAEESKAHSHAHNMYFYHMRYFRLKWTNCDNWPDCKQNQMLQRQSVRLELYSVCT